MGGAYRRDGHDPVPGFRFAIEVQGVVAGWFTECGGLSVERKVHTYEEGGLNAYVHQLPDRISHSRITLKRGIADPALWQWFAGEKDEGLYEGKVAYRNVTIILYGVDHKEAGRWNVANALPVKWNGPEFRTDGDQLAVETLELAHEGFSLVFPKAR